MAAFEIPLTPQAQVFDIQLAAVTYRLRVVWNDSPLGGGWVADIADASEIPIAHGIPFVTGTDLLAQLRYLGIGGGLLVQTDSAPNAVPTFTNLGLQGHLYFITPDADGTPDVQ